MMTLAQRMLDDPDLDMTALPSDQWGDKAKNEYVWIAALNGTPNHPALDNLTWRSEKWRDFCRRLQGAPLLGWVLDLTKYPNTYAAGEAQAVDAFLRGQYPDVDEEFANDPVDQIHVLLWRCGFGRRTLNDPALAAVYLSSAENPPDWSNLSEVDRYSHLVLGAVLAGASQEQVEPALADLMTWAEENWPPGWFTNYHPFVVIAAAELISEGARLS